MRTNFTYEWGNSLGFWEHSKDFFLSLYIKFHFKLAYQLYIYTTFEKVFSNITYLLKFHTNWMFYFLEKDWLILTSYSLRCKFNWPSFAFKFEEFFLTICEDCMIISVLSSFSKVFNICYLSNVFNEQFHV